MATPSNTVPLTVQDIMDQVHTAYEQATDTPSLTDDDGKIRLNLINKGIARWEFEDGVRWRELWTYNATNSALTVNTPAYDLSEGDFRELGSKIRFVRSETSKFYIPLVTPETYGRHINENKQVAAISGNPRDGYRLNLGWIPAANDGTTGAVPFFDYYRYATHMTSISDIPEMSNPWFLVDFVTAELFANDDPNLFEKFNSDALAKLANMRTENEALPPFVSNAVDNQGTYEYSMG